MDSQVLPATSASLALLIVAALFLAYCFAHPRPLAGIPHHAASARRILGDIPAIASHQANTGGSFITYLTSSVRDLKSPLIQIFIKPWDKPILVLSDFREAHDLLVHRGKEFDRSPALGDLLTGLVPDHHIHLKTGDKWKGQRRLTQDLMLPSFLNEVAGPAIYQSLLNLVKLWRVKNELAKGRPWSAAEDMKLMALDSMMTFAFGHGIEHDAIRPMLDLLTGVQDGKAWTMRKETDVSHDEPLNFPQGKLSEVLEAIQTLCGTVMDLHGAPFPALQWAVTNRKPRIRRARRTKDEFIRKQLQEAIGRRERSAKLKAAVDQMVLSEKRLAEKEGRYPEFFSGVMFDELFGFIFAGSETTMTTMCWSLKYLTDNPRVQDRLRLALQIAYPSAIAEHRHPTIEEITSARIPYLDATMEEMLRCAGTSPFIDRAATVDTQLLGHFIPRGTVVLCLLKGPSMTSPAFEIDDGCRFAKIKSERENGDRRVKAWAPHDMAAFMPDRWLGKGNSDKEKFDPTSGPTLAFGLGARGCFGRRLVYLELRILLTLMLWNFWLETCPPAYSGYDAVLRATNEPKQCYVRLRETDMGSRGVE